jgi:hypothetical protein
VRKGIDAEGAVIEEHGADEESPHKHLRA